VWQTFRMRLALALLALVVAGCGGSEDDQANAPEAPEVGQIRARGLTCLAGIGGDGKAVITFAPGQFGPTIEGHYRPGIEPADTAWTPERGYVLLDHPTPDAGETWTIAITNTVTREIRWSMLATSGDGGGAGPCTIPPG
jgi:hypothetical protein